MAKTSILLSHERSGSHLVGEYIGSLENFRMVDEVCNPGAVRPGKHPESFHRFRYDYILKDESYLLDPSRQRHVDFCGGFFDHLRRLKAPNDIAIDIKYGHVQNFEWWWCPVLERPFLLTLAQEIDIGIVHLYRENVVEATVSSLIADKRKVWHSWEAGADRPPERYNLPVPAIVYRAKLLERQTALYKDWSARNRKLSLTYEEVSAGLEDGGEAQSRLNAFLGSKPKRAFKPKHRKLTPPLREVVENYDELKRACDAEGLSRFVP
ncbi:MAG: hypothetical protein JOZ72_07920 [Alphaproteobacteria bacterium]|nr:hypothetical protein [Alphaproteobacteria bacterium]